MEQEIRLAARKRRTFAIISHPDAGKTTLTEKLLLYSGMVRTAGMVGARKSGKLATSDWMEMEQERGISITASAMQFPYKEAVPFNGSGKARYHTYAWLLFIRYRQNSRRVFKNACYCEPYPYYFL